MSGEDSQEHSDDTDTTCVSKQGRLAGIDYGTVRIGVAISDPSQSIASPLENYTRRSKDQDGRYFKELARQEELVGWIVGLPVHLSGKESQKSTEARAFGKWLSELTSLPMRLHDERYSSAYAEEILGMGGLTQKQRKKRRDMLAAQIILATWLESCRSENHGSDESPIDDV